MNRCPSFIALVLLFGCDQSPSGVSNSLVAAKEAPSVQELSGDVIQINRWDPSDRNTVLSYELRPNNSLLVSHSIKRPGGERVTTRETLELSAEVARQAKNDLRLVRPQPLRGAQYDTLPIGCPIIIDALPEVTITFIAADGQIGVFVLPDSRSCKAREAIKARDAIGHVLNLISTGKVTAGGGSKNPR